MAERGMAALERREWVYVQRPREYEIAGCECGNEDPDWSEFKRYLWCAACAKDFIPAHNGIFDGPIPMETARMIGIDLRQYSIATGEILDPYADTNPPNGAKGRG